MAYGRARRASSHEHFWPGYVDVLSTLLLVVTFLLSIFMVAQFYVSQEAGSKEIALRRVSRQLAELTSLLSLEKGKSKSSEDELAALQASLATLKTENERLTGLAGPAATRTRASPH
jgi:chemotaxis protein MotB